MGYLHNFQHQHIITMKFSTVASVATLLAAPVLSAPTDIKYGPPKGGWESVDYPRAQARISSTIQLLPEVGRTSTIPRGPARTLSTIHLLLEVGRTSTTPRELARTSSITHHHQRAMMTRKTTNQNSPADTILQLLVLKSATALFLYQVQPMLLDTTTMESTPRPRESAGKSRFSM